MWSASSLWFHKVSTNVSTSLGGMLLAVYASTQLGSSRAYVHGEGFKKKIEKEVALNPKEWRPFRVKSVTPVAKNVSRLRFELPSEHHMIGLPVASCLMARAKVDGKNAARPYTPVTSNEELGYMDLVVKGYEHGKLSKHIVNLKPGDELEMKGPFLKQAYEANSKKHIGMIAGGSGITPMLQVIKEIVRNPMDDTKVTLLFANVTESDIVLKDELDALQHLHPQLKVVYCLDRAPAEWSGFSGYITSEMITSIMPQPSDDHMIMVCGPPPMMYHISGNKAKDKSQGEVDGLLKELQYSSSMVFKF